MRRKISVQSKPIRQILNHQIFSVYPPRSTLSAKTATKKVMRKKVAGKVGRKGELFPPKIIRQQAGFRPGDQVTYEALEGMIQVQKVPTLKEAFAQKKFARLTFKKFEEMTSDVLFPS